MMSKFLIYSLIVSPVFPNPVGAVSNRTDPNVQVILKSTINDPNRET